MRYIYFPAGSLLLTLLLIYLSGNDKAPFLLPLPLALSVAVAIPLLVRASTRRLGPLMIVLFPWLYVIAAVVLSRTGIISSFYTLGFR